MTTTDLRDIKVIQPPKSDTQIVSAAQPDASPDEVTASTCSCVVHLCGCDNPE